MWAWDFTPPSSWRYKKISAKDLKKMKENYEKAGQISQQAIEEEKKYKNKAQNELDGLIDEIL